MKLLKVLVGIVIISLVQTLLVNRFSWFRYVDLFLLFNLYYAFNFGQLTCMAVSVPSGLVQDALSRGILGMNAFAKTIVVFAVSGLSSRLMLKHPLVIMALIFLSCHLDFLIVFALDRLFRLQTVILSYDTIVLASLLNSIIGITAFQIVDRLRVRKEYV